MVATVGIPCLLLWFLQLGTVIPCIILCLQLRCVCSIDGEERKAIAEEREQARPPNTLKQYSQQLKKFEVSSVKTEHAELQYLVDYGVCQTGRSTAVSAIS